MPRPYFHNKFSHIDEILRVDHAGEYGAIRIYEGQLSSLRGAQRRGNLFCIIGLPPEPKGLLAMTDAVQVLTEMLLQEQKHLAYFETAIVKNRARPTLLLPIWNIFGFAMGYLSALAGVKVSMLTTEAVEEVIDVHYQDQHKMAIAIGDKILAAKIEQHRIEELHHKNTAIEYGSQDAIFYPYLKMAIGKLCKLAIFASKII